MSTYEALFDLFQSLKKKSKSLSGSLRDYDEGAMMMLELHDRHMAVLGNVNYQRLMFGRRALIAAKKFIARIEAEVDQDLGKIEEQRLQRDVAVALGEMTASRDIEVAIDLAAKETQDSLQEAFVLIEEVERILGNPLPILSVA